MLDFDDVHALYNFGRKYTQTGDMVALEDAVTFWVAAAVWERTSVRLNFEEGVRNYSGNMVNYNKIMEFFDKHCAFVDRDQVGLANVHYKYSADF